MSFAGATIGPPSSHQLSQPLLSEEDCLLFPRCGSMTISSCWCPGCSAKSSRRSPLASSSTSPPQGPLGHTPPFHTSSHSDPEGAHSRPPPPSSTFFFLFRHNWRSPSTSKPNGSSAVGGTHRAWIRNLGFRVRILPFWN